MAADSSEPSAAMAESVTAEECPVTPPRKRRRLHMADVEETQLTPPPPKRAMPVRRRRAYEQRLLANLMNLLYDDSDSDAETLVLQGR